MKIVWSLPFAFFLSATLAAGCFESSTHVPPAPALGKDVNSCSGHHEIFIQSGDMAGERAYQTATLLSDGRVLFAGGYLSSGITKAAALIDSEVYEPSSRSFHATRSAWPPKRSASPSNSARNAAAAPKRKSVEKPRRIWFNRVPRWM
jgi:hypothetical protein